MGLTVCRISQLSESVWRLQPFLPPRRLFKIVSDNLINLTKGYTRRADEAHTGGTTETLPSTGYLLYEITVVSMLDLIVDSLSTH